MKSALAFIACVLIWGSTWYAIEWQIGVVSNNWSVAYRFGISALLITCWALVRRQSLRLERQQHIACMGLGFLMFFGNYVLVYHGTEYLTSGLVAVAFSLMSFLNIIFARLFLGIRIQAMVLGASIIGVTGLSLIFWPEFATFSLSDGTAIGLMFCLSATTLASLGNTLAATQTVQAIPLLTMNAWGMAYGTLFNSVLALMMGDMPAFDPRPEYWIALAALSVFGSVIAFTLYLDLLNRVGVGQAAYIMVLTPIVALIISTIYEGYVWTGYAAIGLVLIIAGNIIMIRSRQKQPG